MSSQLELASNSKKKHSSHYPSHLVLLAYKQVIKQYSLRTATFQLETKDAHLFCTILNEQTAQEYISAVSYTSKPPLSGE